MLSVTILVCPVAPELAHVHDRMPVVLSPKAVDRWLEAPDAELLVPNAVDLTAWRVSPAVNSSRHQEADAVTPTAA